MTVGELIAILEGMDENAQVLLAQQPRWAFEYSISNVVEVDKDSVEEKEIRQTLLEGELTDQERMEAQSTLDAMLHDKVVYIAEGEQIGYLSASADEVWR